MVEIIFRDKLRVTGLTTREISEQLKQIENLFGKPKKVLVAGDFESPKGDILFSSGTYRKVSKINNRYVYIIYNGQEEKFYWDSEGVVEVIL